ncbi:MAG TPA: nucleoside monophosphate kinase [Candidatus Saccharimonadales bacterium]|nr:nucleoside monophosphate kinase [Candidatus Saccharimonadales bacterium]
MIIFMGVAGSGKSLQGKMLADEHGLPWLSTGEFLRMLISGRRRKEMLEGKLLDDHEIITLIQKILGIIDSQQEFVLDGFPRTPAQADWLLNQVKHKQLKITKVVNLQAKPEIVRQRLIDRGRQDDYNEAIDERFKEYQETILPIVEEFKDYGIEIVDIDGGQSLQAVHDQIAEALALN